MFASPIRRRVMVSCAFVGMPLRSVLEVVSEYQNLEKNLYILSEFQVFLPVRDVFVQEIKTTPDEGVTKEAKTNTGGSHLHEHGGRSQQGHSDGWNENTG